MLWTISTSLTTRVTEIQKKMRDMLRGHTAKSTKDDEAERKTVINEAKDIVKKNFSAFGY